MAKRKKKYQYSSDYPALYETQSFEFTWCCDCGLRHIWHFEIIKNEKGEQMIKISGTDDPLATKLRKFYNKNKK